MPLKSEFRTAFLCQLIVVFLISCSMQTRADDKHKSGDASSSSSKPAPPAHQSGGSSSHGNSGGGSGRSSSSGASHQSSNSNYGRSAGNSGRTANTGGDSGNSRSSNGNYNRTTTSNGNSSHSGNTGSYEKPAGGPHNNDARNTGNYNQGNNNNNSSYHNSRNNNNGYSKNPSNNNDAKDSHNNHERNSSYSHNDSNNGHNNTVINNRTSIKIEHAPRRVETRIGSHTVARDSGGRVREIREVHDRRGREMVIRHDTYGRPRYVTVRSGGDGRIVGFGHGRGFAERRYYAPSRRVYYQRTYVYGGRRYAVAYRYYPYRGVYYYGYAPAYYYRPVFYGWAYRPWAAPVYFHWGWGGDPWYPYYGYYFRPYPYYDSASLWLTDYLIAENLRLAYEAQAQANAAAAAQYSYPQSNEAALSPEVKQMIADEVQRQLAVERSAAEQPQPASATGPVQGENVTPAEEVPSALDPNQKVFIVASNLDLEGEQGECTVTPGDILVRTGSEPDQSNRIGVTVVSSKKGDCAVSTNSDVEVAELQEMHNHFREKLDSGLKTLADNSGKNGLPAAPDTSTVAGEVAPPQPDSDAAKELEEQQKSAEKTEQQVQRSAGPGQP